MSGGRNNGHKREPGRSLTPAEERAVERVAAGDTDKRAGRYLGRDYLTVRDQVQSAMKKLGAKTRPHLIALWLKQLI